MDKYEKWASDKPAVDEDKLFETYECPCCKGELDDRSSVFANKSWLECQDCEFKYEYE